MQVAFGTVVVGILIGAGPAGAAQGADGIWPTDRMVEYWLQRMVGGLKRQYELDDEQARRVEDLMLARWTTFFKEHRAQMEPLLTEFIEAQLRPQAPEGAQVQTWATGAVEALADLRAEIAHGQAEIRQVLRPEQKMKFDADAVKLAVGTQAIQARLQRWADGDVEDGAMWRFGRQIDGEQNRRPRGAGTGEVAPNENTAFGRRAASRPALDKWEEYVERFIRKNELNESQATTARSILNELRGRAESHRKRTAEEVERLERRLAELRLPLDEFFGELTERLDGLVTSRGRVAGEKKGER